MSNFAFRPLSVQTRPELRAGGTFRRLHEVSVVEIRAPMTPRFDPTRAIVYDLARGQLKDEEGASRLNLPMHLVARLCEQAGEAAASDFAQGLGGEIGRRVADRLGEETGGASVEAWTEHLGGQLALVGLGDVAVERWGRALVLRVSAAPEGASALLDKVLSAALQRALGRDVAAVLFPTDGVASFLVLSPDAADKARSLAKSGSSLAQVVEELHRGAA